MSSKVKVRGIVPGIEAKHASEAWLLAAAKMPRLSRVIFQLHFRDRSYAEIAKRLRISRRRVRRGMVEAIKHIDLAFREVADRRRSP